MILKYFESNIHYNIGTVFITTTTSVSMEIMNRLQTDFPEVRSAEPIGVLFFPLTRGERMIVNGKHQADVGCR